MPKQRGKGFKNQWQEATLHRTRRRIENGHTKRGQK
jgi:hypothetical protein